MLMHQLLLDGADRTPDKLCFRWVDRDRTLTYAEAVVQMERMAGALHHLGVRKGDRVGLFAHNGMDYLAAMLGAWRLGAIAALVNVKFADELEYYWGDHEPKVVVYTHDMLPAVARARAACPSVEHIVCMDGPQEGAHSLPELMAAALPPPPDPWDERATAHLSYTSGTTGKPKGACLAHEPTVTAARCIGERLRIGPADASFGPTALSSSYQLVANLLPPLARMATINVMGRWTQATGWDAIDRTGATVFVGNPTVLDEILVESRARGRSPGRIRLALTGGGPLPPTLKAAWRDELGLPIVESYGQSELGGFVALGFPELVPPGADLVRIGPALPDKEVRIVGPDDRPLPLGEVGDIVLRGGFMAGYWGKPEKTAEATRGGWLRTGDLGVMDADGFVTLRSRKAELLTVAGVDWYPRDVEEALCRQPGIRQAALIGLAHPDLGQTPTAFVTLHPGAAVDPATLAAAIRPEVPYDLAPLVVKAVPELPMTPTGKISKGDLAALVAAGRI
ncbi:class I adenylate-forming enzyme family protein [Prosthecomicrobium sp. N25]|uniref:class I adenylate-forming enzyme family protein n=1 Tax=Prosthecomicrobium sp. N25 TaxID=3129254 RepID=UPI0030789352